MELAPGPAPACAPTAARAGSGSCLFSLRLAVQLPLYLAGAVVALGVARVAMGVPLFAVGIWLTLADPPPADVTLRAALRSFPPLLERLAAAVPAVGLVPARDVEAPCDVPRHPLVAVDGYALRAIDAAEASALLPAFLELAVGEVRAGTAEEVAAGAPLPRGADAVVPAGAATAPLPGHLELVHPVAPGDGVVQPGAELRAGHVLMRARHAIGAADLERLERAGVETVPVAAPPRFGIVGGDAELADVVRAAGGDPGAPARPRATRSTATTSPSSRTRTRSPVRWRGRDVALADDEGTPVIVVTGPAAAILPVAEGLLAG